MTICNYIESYIDKVRGRRVNLWQRGDYLYELAQGASNVKWFHDMGVEEVREYLSQNFYELIEA